MLARDRPARTERRAPPACPACATSSPSSNRRCGATRSTQSVPYRLTEVGVGEDCVLFGDIAVVAMSPGPEAWDKCTRTRTPETSPAARWRACFEASLFGRVRRRLRADGRSSSARGMRSRVRSAVIDLHKSNIVQRRSNSMRGSQCDAARLSKQRPSDRIPPPGRACARI